jgi:hypothetical protein
MIALHFWGEWMIALQHHHPPKLDHSLDTASHLSHSRNDLQSNRSPNQTFSYQKDWMPFVVWKDEVQLCKSKHRRNSLTFSGFFSLCRFFRHLPGADPGLWNRRSMEWKYSIIGWNFRQEPKKLHEQSIYFLKIGGCTPPWSDPAWPTHVGDVLCISLKEPSTSDMTTQHSLESYWCTLWIHVRFL